MWGLQRTHNLFGSRLVTYEEHILAPPPPPLPHAHHLFKLDLDLSVYFSHLKEHVPCREKTKKDNKQKEGGEEGEREESDIKSFQCLQKLHTSCKKLN